MNGIKSTVIVLMVLSLSLVSFLQIGVVKAQNIIYIKVDGSIEGTDHIQRNGSLYLLTSNISGGIQIQRSNIIFEGSGYTLNGDGEIHGPTDVIGMGLEIVGCNNVSLRNLNIKEFTRGIRLTNSFDCDLYCNTISDNSIGIEMGGMDRSYLLAYSNSNRVTGNIIRDNDAGLRLFYGTSNIISKNIFTGNGEAISIWGPFGNTIAYNNITCNNRGVYVEVSGINFVHHNNFVDNTNDWWDYGLTPWPFQLPFSVTSWDDGIEGNYWSKYDGSDTNGDGIGNTPHRLYENNTDNYPLMKSVNFKIIPEFPSWTLLIAGSMAITVLSIIFKYHFRQGRRK
jgi:parallel beta-helix repeat protein